MITSASAATSSQNPLWPASFTKWLTSSIVGLVDRELSGEDVRISLEEVVAMTSIERK
jgi:hypothetical protein